MSHFRQYLLLSNILPSKNLAFNTDVNQEIFLMQKRTPDNRQPTEAELH